MDDPGSKADIEVLLVLVAEAAVDFLVYFLFFFGAGAVF